MKVRQSSSAPVGVLTKVLSIFDLLDRSPDGLQLRAIAEQTMLNKSTTYRFLAHLEKGGYMVRESGGAYLLGPRLVHLGSGSTYQSTIRRISRPILEALWRETGETVNLGVLAGRDVLYLDVLESPHDFQLVSKSECTVRCTAQASAKRFSPGSRQGFAMSCSPIRNFRDSQFTASPAPRKWFRNSDAFSAWVMRWITRRRSWAHAASPHRCSIHPAPS